MENWTQVLVTAAIVLAGQAFTYGMLSQKVKDHGEDIEKLQDSDQRQWHSIGKNDSEIAYLRGKLAGTGRVNGKAAGHE